MNSNGGDCLSMENPIRLYIGEVWLATEGNRECEREPGVAGGDEGWPRGKVKGGGMLDVSIMGTGKEILNDLPQMLDV